jgi:transcriptional regulator with XRE-family HTH domain
MKKLNLGKSIIQKRKEKGITQEKLAEYMGVSKAAVSKWESGQSYPDILLLPELATYFNISVDELLGYSPQMSREEIWCSLSYASCPSLPTLSSGSFSSGKHASLSGNVKTGILYPKPVLSHHGDCIH